MPPDQSNRTLVVIREVDDRPNHPADEAAAQLFDALAALNPDTTEGGSE